MQAKATAVGLTNISLLQAGPTESVGFRVQTVYGNCIAYTMMLKSPEGRTMDVVCRHPVDSEGDVAK